MSNYQIVDPRFNAKIISHALVEKLWQGGRWLEGPAYFAAGRYLVFSDIPNNRLMRYDETNQAVSVFRQPSNNTNGNTVDEHGRLISCEHLTRRVTRTEHDGSISVIASHFDSKRLNSPNDAICRADGSIWFTDPTYGIDSDYEGSKASSEIGASNVYRIDRSGIINMIVKDRLRPNGLAICPNNSRLYVSDTGASHQDGHPRAIHVYSLGSLVTPAGIFCETSNGFFDGFRLDSEGCLWTSAGDSVHCYHPDGTLLGAVRIGETVSNVCFGGTNKNRLYITAQTSLYSLFLNCSGA